MTRTSAALASSTSTIGDAAGRSPQDAAGRSPQDAAGRSPEDAARRSPPDATTLSAFGRWRRALAALGKVMIDPTRTDQVLVFSIYANAGSMPMRIDRFFASEAGRRLYEEHRTIDSRSIDLDALAALPAGTLGHAYAQFLR